MITAYKWHSIARTTTIGASTGIRVEFGESYRILLTTSIDWGNAVISVQNSNLSNTIVASVRLRQNGIHYYLDLKVSQSFSTDFKIELYDNTYWEESSGVSDLAGATLCIIDDINSINTPSSYGESFFQEDENGDLVPIPKSDGTPRGIWTNSFMSSGGRNTTNPGGGGGISYFDIIFENDPDTKYPLSNGVVTLPAYPTIPNLSNYITKDFADTTYLSKTEFKAFKDIFDSMFAFDKDGYIHAKKSLWSDGFLSSGGKNASTGEGGGGISYFEIVFENDPDTKYALDDGVVTLPAYPDLSGYLPSTTKYALSGSVGGDALNALKLGGNLPAYYATASSVSVLSDALSSFRSLFDEMFEKDADGHIHAKLGLYSDSFLSSGGKNTSSGSGGGLTKFSIIFNGDTYDSDNGVATIDGVYATENYVDTAIANLINGAPTTLDTLKEIADAFAASQDVITALNLAIGSKAAQTDLETLQGYFTGSIANEAAKVSNTLSFGTKTYDGSASRTITAADLGALTSHQTIYKLTFNAGAFTAADFTANTSAKTINIPTTTTHISEGTNLYYTDERTLNAITGAASTIKSDDLTVSRALISNVKGKVAVSDITSTELGHLDGVTKNIQTQFTDTNTKIDNFIALFNRLFTYEGTEANPTSIHAKLGLWTDSYLSSGGKNESGGSGGGGGLTSFSVVLNNKTYTSDNGVATITEQLQPKITAANPLPYSLVSGTPTLGSLAYKNSLTASDVPDLSGSYLSTSGGTITNDLNILTGDSDKFINWIYTVTSTIGASWRLGMAGGGTGNTNYFTLQSGTSSTGTTVWYDVLKFGQNDFTAYFSQVPYVGSNAVIHAGTISNYNAGSATKLQTARTIWGQSFDGTGNVSGALYLGAGTIRSSASGTDRALIDFGSAGAPYIGYGTASAGIDTHICGNNMYLHYGTSRNFGLILNSSGNVTIGSSDLASTSAKLHIDGNLRIGSESASYTTQNYLYLWKGDGTYRHRGLLGVYEGGAFFNYYNPSVGTYRDFILGPDGLVYKTTTGTATQFEIKANGNVLIGTSTDSGHKLQVEGTGDVLNLSNSSGGDVALRFSRGTKTSWSIINSGGNLRIVDNFSSTLRMLLYENSQGGGVDITGNLRVGGYSVYHTGNFNPANYLPLSGGTVGKGTTALAAFNVSTANSAGYPAIGFYSGDTRVGLIRIEGDRLLRIYDSAFNATATVLTSINYSNYALPLSGGTMTGAIVIDSFTSFGLSSGTFYLGHPNYPLTIRSTGGATFTDAIYNPVLRAYKGTSSVATLHITNITDSLDYSHIYVSNADNSRKDRPLVLQNGYGNVGIGVAQPSYKLEVSGNVGITGNIYASGDIEAFNSSDARLKENITTISDDRAIDILSRLNPVTFAWNEIATSLSSRLQGDSQGFIAQEWEKIIPNASGTMWGKYKGIDYIQTIPYLTKGWQIHETKIKRLEREVKELKDKLAKYESIS